MELWRRVEKMRESYGGDKREQRLELWSKEAMEEMNNAAGAEMHFKHVLNPS